MPNKKVLEEKKQKVVELEALLKATKTGVLVDYRGLSVADDTELRNKLRAAGVTYSVIKNRLIKFALEGANLAELEPILKGPTALATSADDVVAPAKVLHDFAKENELLEIKGGFMEGKVVDIATIKQLATLPSKEVLLSKLLGSLQSPMYGLANVLQGNISGLARALGAAAAKAS
ncbi:MAG: 50S ribosomal protein L10 [Oscillospiraceae bacterium]|nr:50S ribosomal protein L10 [Oscillospiraceae bacterium]